MKRFRLFRYCSIIKAASLSVCWARIDKKLGEALLISAATLAAFSFVATGNHCRVSLIDLRACK